MLDYGRDYLSPVISADVTNVYQLILQIEEL